jgi:hypothetical protein
MPQKSFFQIKDRGLVRFNDAEVQLIKNVVNEIVAKAVEDLTQIMKDFMQQSADRFEKWEKKWEAHDAQLNKHEYILQDHSTALVHINNQLRLLSPPNSDTI